MKRFIDSTLAAFLLLFALPIAITLTLKWYVPIGGWQVSASLGTWFFVGTGAYATLQWRYS